MGRNRQKYLTTRPINVIVTIVLELQACRDIVQLVERWSPKPNVEGSSPSVPVMTGSKKIRFFLSIPQNLSNMHKL